MLGVSSVVVLEENTSLPPVIVAIVFPLLSLIVPVNFELLSTLLFKVATLSAEGTRCPAPPNPS